MAACRTSWAERQIWQGEETAILVRNYCGVRAEQMVEDGILTTADREKADLNAIASHGRTGLAQVFYGSVAAGVLHRVDGPLLVV